MDPFLEALRATGPSPELGEALQLYGRFIGSWQLDVREYAEDGALLRRRPGEWHFGWVLDGRAIQDVWIVPARGHRGTHPREQAEYYGSTLRVYDPASDTWRILWSDPVAQAFVVMTGRARGEDIVQEGTDSAGRARRWSFVDMTPASFLWRGEVSPDGGGQWHRHIEFDARRA